MESFTIMIILPEKNEIVTKYLMPVKNREWKQPSQRKTIFGIEDQTRFRLRARLNDGFIKWTGWFDDRRDADAFLFALATDTINYERSLWDLPSPPWSNDIGENVTYEFATVSFLTSSPGSFQTYSVPSDFGTVSNSIEGIGGGGDGAYTPAGGGGAYSKKNNVVLTRGSSVKYQVGTNGGAQSGTSATYFRDNSNTNVMYAEGGSTGGNIGGSSTNGTGDVKYSGGTGGNRGNNGGGGGGAAGPNGNGGNGGSGFSGQNCSPPYGGQYWGAGGGGNGGGSAGNIGYCSNGIGGNNYLGSGAGNNSDGTNGGGGSGGNVNPSAGFAGGAGIEWDATHGSGGGGGGGGCTYANAQAGGPGGLYGGGGGSGAETYGATSGGGVGKQGLIVVTYTPYIPIGFNSPNLGI